LFLAAYAAGATNAQEPILGHFWPPDSKGYGTVRPTTIFNGGDPTGLVSHIRWHNWGKPLAVGIGEGDYVWPGLGVADGSTAAVARIVAFDLGTCDGKLMYREVEWYFPRYGERFNPTDPLDTCTHVYGGGMPQMRQCGSVGISSTDSYRATDIQVEFGASCGAARRLIEFGPSARYVHRGGRFVEAGYFCGSEGLSGSIGPDAAFDCDDGVRLIGWYVARTTHMSHVGVGKG
jgi:hypothetical protein